MRAVKLGLLLLIFYQNILAISVWDDLADYQAPSCKKFVFVICSRNNAQWVEQNLNSAACQEYPRDRFRFIYVDDNSSDDTVNQVTNWVNNHNEWDRFILIRNDSWQSIMPNHYKAAYLCEDDEIIVHLDGDDFIKHSWVLYLLNKVYSYDDVWLTYGQYENWPVAELGFSIDVPAHIAQQNQFREMGFWYSHLRTFYAWLFKKIALKDLIWKGSFIPTTPTIDYLIMFPLMELAGNNHYRFISDGLYLYNRTNALSTCNMPIKIEIAPAKTWQKYQPLDQAESDITSKRKKRAQVCVLIAADEGVELERFKEIELPKINNYEADTIFFIPKTHPNPTAFHDFLKFVPCNYYLLITDVSIHLPECDLEQCAYELERTAAPFFFLGLRKASFKPCNEPINYGPFAQAQIEYRLAILGNGIAAWEFAYEDYVWHDPKLTAAVLMPAKVLKDIFKDNNFDDQLFKKGLFEIMSHEREIGLLFE